MDPYSNVIPDEDQDGLRKRLRERDDDSAEESIEEPKAKRARSDTVTLLSSQDNNEEEMQPPQPEDDVHSYDRERLLKGLQYVSRIVKGNRRITPRTRQFLEMQKDAIKVALEQDSPNDASLAVVREYDIIYHSAAFQLAPRTPDDFEKLNWLTQLRKLQLMGNYGDYLGQNLGHMRQQLGRAAHHASADLREAYAGLKGPKEWGEIAKELARGGPIADQRHKDVETCCRVLNLDKDETLWTIKEWGLRNETFHNKVKDYIQRCAWDDLKAQLVKDLGDVLNATDNEAEGRAYQRAIYQVLCTYFETPVHKDSHTWYVNAYALELSAKKREADKKKAAKLPPPKSSSPPP